MATIGAHKNWKPGDFIISEVDANFLKQHKIDMKIKDFKTLVKMLEPRWIGLAGGCGKFRKVNVYNIKAVKDYIEKNDNKEDKL